MNNTILRKSLFAYAIFATLSFLLTATVSYHINEDRIIKETARNMYAQAVSIADNYGSHYYASDQTLKQIREQLEAVASLSETRIMFISRQNAVILDTGDATDDAFITLSDFDPAASGNNLYTTGDFYGIFDRDVITVTVPITYKLSMRGYVVIHMDEDTILEKSNLYFNTKDM